MHSRKWKFTQPRSSIFMPILVENTGGAPRIRGITVLRSLRHRASRPQPRLPLFPAQPPPPSKQTNSADTVRLSPITRVATRKIHRPARLFPQGAVPARETRV